MPLADDIRALQTRTTTELDASHDYFTFSMRVWDSMQRAVRDGARFRYNNPSTGTRVNQTQLVARSGGYIAQNLLPSTFQHFVSIFEDFVFDLLRLWLSAYPRSLSRKQLEFGVVLDAPDRAALIQRVVDRELNELKYERLADWFAYLERLVNLGRPTADEIEALSEIKASRDILVHGRGVANAIYVSKAGKRARCAAGEQLDLPERYHRESWGLIRRVSHEVAEAAIARA